MLKRASETTSIMNEIAVFLHNNKCYCRSSCGGFLS